MKKIFEDEQAVLQEPIILQEGSTKVEKIDKGWCIDALNKDYFLFRAPAKNGRWYMEQANEDTLYYKGVTSVIEANLAHEEFEGLGEWQKQKTPEEIAEIKRTSVHYGVWMHKEFDQAQILGIMDTHRDSLSQRLLDFSKTEKYDFKSIPLQDWIDRMQKALYGFKRFTELYQVEKLGVELALRSKAYWIAGSLDLLCNMTVPVVHEKSGKKKPGEFEQITGIVDYKSGTKGFYATNKYQVRLYRVLVKENYPDINPRTFLYGCHDYRMPIKTKATIPYKLKEVKADEVDWGLKHVIGRHLDNPKGIRPKFPHNIKEMVLDMGMNVPDDVFESFDPEKFITGYFKENKPVSNISESPLTEKAENLSSTGHKEEAGSKLSPDSQKAKPPEQVTPNNKKSGDSNKPSAGKHSPVKNDSALPTENNGEGPETPSTRPATDERLPPLKPTAPETGISNVQSDQGAVEGEFQEDLF